MHGGHSVQTDVRDVSVQRQVYTVYRAIPASRRNISTCWSVHSAAMHVWGRSAAPIDTDCAPTPLYYLPQKAAPKVQPQLAQPVKEMIEENPSFGYRTVAGLLGMNKNTVQRIFQLKGWQVKKRPVGFRPAIGGS